MTTKKTRIFYGNQYIGSTYITGETSKVKRFINHLARRIKQTLVISASFCFIAWMMVLSAYYVRENHPKIVEAEIITEVPVFDMPPVLERIAVCESGGTHYRNGQVIFNANKNGTVDIGMYQINSIHSKTASKMGLDLTKEDDNRKFAIYLYQNYGTEPWYSSKACWNK